MFEEMKKAMAKAHEISKIVRDVDDKMLFTSLIATVFDQWAADHDVAPDDEREMVNAMLSVMEGIHAEYGALPKSV